MKKIDHPGWAIKYPGNPEGEWWEPGCHGSGCSYNDTPYLSEFFNTAEEAKSLVKPALTEVITLQYLWWDQLKEKLEAQKDATPTGFKDYKKEYKIANLSGVPRVGYDTAQESSSVLRF